MIESQNTLEWDMPYNFQPHDIFIVTIVHRDTTFYPIHILCMYCPTKESFISYYTYTKDSNGADFIDWWRIGVRIDRGTEGYPLRKLIVTVEDCQNKGHQNKEKFKIYSIFKLNLN